MLKTNSLRISLLEKLNHKNFLFFSLFFLIVIFLVFRFYIIFSYSSDIVIGEDNNVWNIQKMLLGKSLYTDPEDYPFEIFQYAPLSQYFTFFTAKFLGFKVGIDTHSLFVIGRLYSLIFNILTSFFIYKISSLFLNINKYVNYVFFFISFVLITYIDYTLRADSLSNLFTILSLLYLFKSITTENIKSIFFTSFFVVLAIFSKQSAFQLIVFYSFIFIYYSRSKTIYWIFFTLLTSGFFCFVFYSIYGSVFFKSTIGGISNPTELKLGVALLLDYTKRFGVVLFPAVIMFFFKVNKNVIDLRVKNILFFIFLASFIFSFGTSQKVGAGLNYYSLNLYISILLCSIFINELFDNKNFKQEFIILSLILIIPSLNILVERMYNRHYSQISSKHRYEYFIDFNFVQLSKNKIGRLNKNEYVFTVNKNIKNLYFRNTILPNTEYYGVSHFDLSKYDRKKIKYLIINNSDPIDMMSRSFNQFKINISEYDLIFEYYNRKLYKIKE